MATKYYISAYYSIVHAFSHRVVPVDSNWSLSRPQLPHQSHVLTLEYMFVYIICDVTVSVYIYTLLLSGLQFCCEYLTIIIYCWQTNLMGFSPPPPLVCLCPCSALLYIGSHLCFTVRRWGALASGEVKHVLGGGGNVLGLRSGENAVEGGDMFM